MTATANTWKLSYGEYAAREETSDVKHEFIDGQLYAMSGGTPEHAALIGAVAVRLGVQLLGGPCRLFTTELRTRIRADAQGPDVGSYPDLAVVCGKVLRDTEDPNSVINPKLIIEVVSKSTEAYDRAGKFTHYQRLTTMEEYVLVTSRGRPRIERFHKKEGGWTSTPDVAERGGSLELLTVRAHLDVDAVYDGLINREGLVELP